VVAKLSKPNTPHVVKSPKIFRGQGARTISGRWRRRGGRWCRPTNGRRLDGAQPWCDGREVQWQAGRFRWVDVVRALQQDPGDRDRPHPCTSEWRQRGLDLPGATRQEQLDRLRSDPSSWLPSYRTILGSGTPPVFERAAGRLSQASDPVLRLEEALTFLTVDDPWRAARLYPAAWINEAETADG
jgi:hypothetical protein